MFHYFVVSSLASLKGHFMQPSFYKPAAALTGPAYSPWFKMLATLFTFGLVTYGISFSMRFSLED
jgi:hypothetical protein